MPNNGAALLQRSGERGGRRRRTGGERRMESGERRRVGTTGSISVKQPFQKALMAEGERKQQPKQVHVRCSAL